MKTRYCEKCYSKHSFDARLSLHDICESCLFEKEDKAHILFFIEQKQKLVDEVCYKNKHKIDDIKQEFMQENQNISVH